MGNIDKGIKTIEKQIAIGLKRIAPIINFKN